VIARNSVWQERTITLDDITDDLSQTLIFVELDLPGVNWMSLTDISLDELLAMLDQHGRILSPHPAGVLMGFADGSVRMIGHAAITPALLRKLVSIDASDPIPDNLNDTPN